MILTASATALVAGLAACEQGKPRHPPPDPMATAPAAAPVAPTEGLSAGLTKRAEMAGFFLGHIGQAVDPRGKPPAVTAADAPILLDGFGFDPVAKAPGKGVDLVVDGEIYGAKQGAARQDVGNFFKTPASVRIVEGFGDTSSSLQLGDAVLEPAT